MSKNQLLTILFAIFTQGVDIITVLIRNDFHYSQQLKDICTVEYWVLFVLFCVFFNRSMREYKMLKRKREADDRKNSLSS